MSAGGVIGVSRGIWSDPEFKPEPFTEREAFLWLVSEAAWKDREVRGAHGPVMLKRGEVCHSVRFMGAAWQWPKSRVARFIARLKKRDTIRDTKRDSEQVYIISNYNKFQVVGVPERDTDRDTKRDANGTAAGQQRDKLEERETLKKDNDTPRAQLLTVLSTTDADAVLEHRKRLRKPLSVRGAELMVKSIQACPCTPSEAVDMMIERGWIAVKPEWVANANAPRPTAQLSDKHARRQAAIEEARRDLAHG